MVGARPAYHLAYISELLLLFFSDLNWFPVPFLTLSAQLFTAPFAFLLLIVLRLPGKDNPTWTCGKENHQLDRRVSVLSSLF